MSPETEQALKEPLLPCPFCGARAYQRDDDPHHIWIECDECQIGTFGHDSIEHGGDVFLTVVAAKRTWNKRTPIQPPSKTGERR